MRPRYRWIAGAAAAALICTALYSKPVTRTYTVPIHKLAADQSFRIALLSDLHSCIYGRQQGELIERVLRGKPDAILLAGDIYDDQADPTGVRLLLDGLQEHAPLYYATGNHEHRVEDLSAVQALMDEFEVQTLSYRAVADLWNGVPVCVAGMDDIAADGGDLDRVTDRLSALRETLPEDCLTVLIAHRPAYWPLYQGFDLVVSGHAHGGQVRVPGVLNGLLAPDEGLFPQYAGGLYWHGAQAHVVSRGLARDWKPRVFNPPEVVFIDVVSAEEGSANV